MEINNKIKEITTVIIGIIILSVTLSIKSLFIEGAPKLQDAFVAISIIIVSSTLVKKLVSYILETDIKIKFWEIKHFGLQKRQTFKKPLVMAWLPLLLSFISLGNIIWMPLFDYELKAKPERAAKRHGIYRYTSLTEWHIALIAISGLLTVITVSMISYILGYEYLAKISTYYALWSLLPFSSLEGSKIFFARRKIWIFLTILILIFFLGTLVI